MRVRVKILYIRGVINSQRLLRISLQNVQFFFIINDVQFLQKYLHALQQRSLWGFCFNCTVILFPV